MTQLTGRSTPAPLAIDKPRLRPDEASAYLEKHHGVRVATGTLMNLRSKGGGPEFWKFGERVYYQTEALDAWAAEKLGTPRRSTSHNGTVQ